MHLWQPFQAHPTWKARNMLSNGTELTIKEALYSPCSGRTLLSIRDIRDDQYHVETSKENGSEFLCITSYEYGQKCIHEKLERLPSGLYITIIRAIETYHMASPMVGFQSTLLLWHDWIGHRRRDMIRRMLKASHGHHLKSYLGHPLCKACSLGKLNIQPSLAKIVHDPLSFFREFNEIFVDLSNQHMDHLDTSWC